MAPNSERLKARGTKVMLEHGGLPEVFPPYLLDLIESTGGPDGPIGRQFVAQPELENNTTGSEVSDPLHEDEHEVAPGLVYKYEAGEDEHGPYFGRALFTITRNCAAYCRYCTRGREVGIPANMEGPLSGALSHTPHLSREQIDESLDYIQSNRGINEVILSGGDPLTVRPEVLNYVLGHLGQMQQNGILSLVRLGTRVPIHNPVAIKDGHYEAAEQIKNLRLMVHINHVLELTPLALASLERFRRQSGAIVMSQSVLLKGVNDDPTVLCELFAKLAEEGIIPYLVYTNDPTTWGTRFDKRFPEVVDLWNGVGRIRNRMSGIVSTARLVIDAPGGYGKIALPEGDAWDVDYSHYRDYHGTTFRL